MILSCSKEPSIYLTKREMLKLDRELFGSCNPYSFLRACSLHVSCRSGPLALKAAMFGATLGDALSPALTHVVLPASTPPADIARVKDNVNAKVVSEEWLEACFARKELVSEEDFLL